MACPEGQPRAGRVPADPLPRHQRIGARRGGRVRRPARPLAQGSRSRRNAAGSRYEQRVQGGAPVHGKPAAPRPAHRGSPGGGAPGGDGRAALPARPGPQGAVTAAPAHPDRGCRRARQDAGGGHPHERAHQAGARQAHPRRRVDPLRDLGDRVGHRRAGPGRADGRPRADRRRGDRRRGRRTLRGLRGGRGWRTVVPDR